MTGFPEDFAACAVGSDTHDRTTWSSRAWTDKQTPWQTAHKTLASASKCASFGRNGCLTRGGGDLILHDSALSFEIKRMIRQERSKANHQMVPLCEEGGVTSSWEWNFKALVWKSNGPASTTSGARNIFGESLDLRRSQKTKSEQRTF